MMMKRRQHSDWFRYAGDSYSLAGGLMEVDDKESKLGIDVWRERPQLPRNLRSSESAWQVLPYEGSLSRPCNPV